MKKLAVKELTVENFNVYGAFANMLDPQTPSLGPAPVEFFRDMVQVSLGQSNLPSFSTMRISNRPKIIQTIEHHNCCGEINMALDSDILLYVGPATANGVVPLEQIEVFRVPKGTLVSIRAGVWHYAPFTLNSAVAHILVVLPERLYATDCNVYEIPAEKQMEVDA